MKAMRADRTQGLTVMLHRRWQNPFIATPTIGILLLASGFAFAIHYKIR